jgi:hypothetical protein
MNGLGAMEITILVMLGVFTFSVFLLVLIPAYQAYHRGYNPVIWGLAGVFSVNPLFILVVLGMVPHRARQRMRDRFAARLDEKLAALAPAPTDEAAGAARADTFTVGDEATRLPHRSIGDDLTRM